MTSDFPGDERPDHGDRRFRTIFDASAVGIAMVDMTGRVVESNAALQETLGYSNDELRGMNFAEFTHPDDVSADCALFADMLADRRDAHAMETRYVRKDGSDVWVKLVACIVRDAEGAPRFGIGMVEDLSRHKQLEAKFLQAQKMEAVGRLAGGIAHDFNNLLTIIRSYSEFIVGESERGDVRRDDAEEICRAADRAALLTKQLLAFSRKEPSHPRLLDVNAVVQDLEKMLGRLIGEDVPLVLRVASEPALVMADEGQLQQVLMNLAVNARDAMPKGGVLTLETANDAATPGHVRISVTDTGPGIPSELHAQIFEPFFTTKDEGKGTGLGLSTVFGIVTQFGGTVSLKSRPGCGATFDVLLPRVGGRIEAPVRGPVAPRATGTETVLIVEDDDAIRKLARRALGELGYNVLAAEGGEEALHIARGYPDTIHAVLADVVMPGMSGPACVAQLGTIRPEMRVLYTSGYTDERIEQHDLFEDGARFIRKPFNQGELGRAVGELLAGRP